MRRKWFICIALVAFPLNLLWENFHANLYEDIKISMVHFMLLCALADVLITLLIYMTVSLLLRNAHWLRIMSWQKILLALPIAVVTAVVMEKLPLSWGWWSYSPQMPVLPWVRVGLSPFLQISLLPLGTFFLVSRFIRRDKRI